MRLVVLGMCLLLAVGVVGAMLGAIWSTCAACSAVSARRRRRVADLVWLSIPCLMALAAAVPTAIAIASTHSGH